MKKKIIWTVVILVLVGVGAYVGYVWNSKNTAKVVEGLINQSAARVRRCEQAVLSDEPTSEICANPVQAGRYTFCWEPNGLSIKCYY